MTHIVKRLRTTDPYGRVLGYTVERLSDDGIGTTGVHRTTTVGRCPGCWRPVASVELITGVCTICARGPLCQACEATCSVCSRGLCRRCRRGFVWGRTPLVVCPSCYRWLNRRAVHEQREAAKQAAFLRAVQLHRERMHGLAMRVQAARMGLGAPLVQPIRPGSLGTRYAHRR